MENFTDLFSDDLSGLEGLGDFSSFTSAGQGLSDGRDGDPNAMMAGGPQYGQQYGTNPQLKVSGYPDQYSQYRGPNPPGGVPTGQPGQNQPYYGNAGSQPSGYPGPANPNIRMGGYPAGPGGSQMLGGMGPAGQYPGYQQQGAQSMYGMDQNQMMSQANAGWGQSAYSMQQQYRPGGPGIPNGPPQASPGFRQQHPNFPNPSDQNMSQQQQLMGYPSNQSQHYSNSQMSAGGPYATSGAPMPRSSQTQMPSNSGMGPYHSYPQQQQQQQPPKPSSQQFPSSLPDYSRQGMPQPGPPPQQSQQQSRTSSQSRSHQQAMQQQQMHSQIPPQMPNQSGATTQPPPGSIGPGQGPTGPSVYRGTFPSPQHPSSQPSMSPGMSPRPMSPASSASPVPGSASKGMHTSGSGGGTQGNSSLQQLEQMVMPGTKDNSQLQQNPKTPKSPSMRGQSTSQSPQQWQQSQPQQPNSRPRSHSGKDQSSKGQGQPGMMHMGPGAVPMSPHPGMHPGMMDQTMMGHPGMHPGMYMGPGNQQGMRMMPPHPSMQQHPMSSSRAPPMGVPGPNAQMMPQGYHPMPPHMLSNQYPTQQPQTTMANNIMGQSQGMSGQQHQKTPQPNQTSHQQQSHQHQAPLQISPQHQGYDQGRLAEDKMPRGSSESLFPSMSPTGLSSQNVLKDDLAAEISRLTETSDTQDSSSLLETQVSSQPVPISDATTQPDRDTMVVTPKLEEDEYKSEYRDTAPSEADKIKCDVSEPSSSNIKPEEPSSTTSPKSSLHNDTESQEKPDSSVDAENTSASEKKLISDGDVVKNCDQNDSAKSVMEKSSLTVTSAQDQIKELPPNHLSVAPVPVTTSSQPQGMPPPMTPLNSSYPMGPGYGPRMPPHPVMGMPPGPYGPQPPNMTMTPNGPMPSRPDGHMGPDPHMMRMPGHPMDGPMGMMRPGMGPMPMHPGMRMPMGPQGMMRPPHPIQMEIQHIHQQLNHLFSQPQNSQVQQQIKDLQGRLHSLQQQLPPIPPAGQWGPGPMGPGMPPGGPGMGHPPDLMSPGVIDGFVKDDVYNFDDNENDYDLDELEGGKKKKGKKTKAYKEPKQPKEPKAPKAPKQPKLPKAPKEPKAPKAPKPPKEPKTPSKKSKKSKKSDDLSEDMDDFSDVQEMETYSTPKKSRKCSKKSQPDSEPCDDTLSGGDTSMQGDVSLGVSIGDNSSTGEATIDSLEAEQKLKKPKVKYSTPKRPKPNKTLLEFAKKKRKRTDSGSDIDIDVTPPSTPKEEDGTPFEKRRSGRNTNNRKKYVDEIDLNLSEDENALPDLPNETGSETKVIAAPKAPINIVDESTANGDNTMHSDDGDVTKQSSPGDQAGPNYAYIDTTAEDTMVVQFILTARMGYRELESDEEDENAFDVPRDQVSKYIPKTNGMRSELLKNQSKSKRGAKVDGVVHADPAKVAEKPVENSDGKSDSEIKTHESDKAESAKDSLSEAKPKQKSESAHLIRVEEYLVKFKNFSYLHCQWLTEEELHRGDKRIGQKVKRFKQKREKSGNVLEFCDEDPFNPEYVEVDRVLDASEHTDDATNVLTKHYLVKWRSLPYEDCTWEVETDVDPLKIAEFQKWRYPPSDDSHTKRRPKKTEWKKLDASPIYKNGNSLRPYQLEGVNWLLFSWYNGRNCLLADEMGLGKTIQSLTFLDGIFKYGIHGPFLVIAPLSTIPNWQREFELWSDMNVIVYHGSQTSRNMLAEYEMFYKDEEGQKLKNVFKFHVLITTYECLIQDILELTEIKWRACVVDEAHRLKNNKCKLLEGLNLLECESRLLLSGTPLQNNIQELYSLLSFLEPTQFNSEEAFIREFGDMMNEDQVTKLQALLKPLMLRRMKEDVEKSLKPKEETIVEVELTNIQKKYYRAILERNFTFLSKGAGNSNVPNLMNTMMELRKCCIHPYLLNGAEEQIQDEYKNRNKDALDDESIYFKALIPSSGKMVLVDKLLPKLKEGGHRVLIFSQMVKMLDILEDYLIRKQYPYERIDGRIRGNLRQAAIDRFCRPESDRFVFLLCTKAGGLGINLVAADTVIIYDSDWNPQNDLQAQARCHRIGQDKMVKIYRLITRNTYEREMFDRASLKLGLDKAVLQSMNTNLGQGNKATERPNQLSKKEIEDLLKKGAYGALMDDDNAGEKFCEEDIEEILQRRTTTVTLEGGQAGGSFAKASFASAETADIAIDDPDFWAKWAKKAEIEEIDETAALMMSEPRSRKKIQRFGGNEALDPREVSDLETSSGSDDEGGVRRGRSKTKKMKLKRSRRGFEFDDDFVGDDGDVIYGSWSKSDLLRIEKAVMMFGWGRWEEVIQHSNLRKGYNSQAVEDAFRMTLLYSVNTYKGDEKIKAFVWDLITPREYGERVGKNHSGLSDPVPRGRKAKKARKEGNAVPDGIAWVSEEKYDVGMYLNEKYRTHLDKHSNRILLRIRMLFYLQQEVLGDLHRQINLPYNEITGLHVPQCEGLPVFWWDSAADKCLIVGTHKHGYEQYNHMRADPKLCFLTRCGPPDSTDYYEDGKHEKGSFEQDDSKLDFDDDSMQSSKTPSECPPSVKPEEAEQATGTSNGSTTASGGGDAAGDNESSSQLLPFPSASELNGRLRRLIAAYQRENKKEEARLAAIDKRIERRERIEQVIREREIQQKVFVEQHKKRWARKEEVDFYRTLLSYGVEYSNDRKPVWQRFKQLARIDRSDESLNDYFNGFMVMIKKQLGISLSDEEEQNALAVDSISEDRAQKVLDRIAFLRKIREDVVTHSKLASRMVKCEQALDMPEWWINGKHDSDLLLGVAKHGLARMDLYVLNDPDLCFKDILKRQIMGEPLVDKKEQRKAEEAKTAAEKGNAIDVKVSSEKQDDEEKDKTDIVKTEGDKSNEKADKHPEVEEMETDETKPKTLEKEESVEGSVEAKDPEEPKQKTKIDEAPENKTLTNENKDTEDMETENSDKNESESPKTKKDPEEKETIKVADNKSMPAPMMTPERRRVCTYIQPPQINIQQMEQMIAKGTVYDLELMNDLMAQTYAAAIKWPKDIILQIRLEHIVKLVETDIWPVPKNYPLGDHIPTSRSTSPDSLLKDSSSRSETSFDDSLSSKKRRNRLGGIQDDLQIDHSPKIRSLLTGTGLSITPTKMSKQSSHGLSLDSTQLSLTDSLRLGKLRTPGLEITPVNGSDSILLSGLKKPLQGSSSKGSKLESALDRLGVHKRKLSEETKEDKSLKKKRLDDIMFGLGAAKGVTLDQASNDGNSSTVKSSADTKVPELNKLQDLLGRPDSPSEAKVQKWLADQVGVVPDRPTTPSTSAIGKSPKGHNATDWMNNLSGDEHVTVFNRFTGKKLSGTQGPKLKFLAQWLIENPMFEVDPKWSDLFKTKEKEAAAQSSNGGKRKQGRPSAEAGVGPSFSSSGLSTMAGLDPKNPMAALAALDPKNPMSFAALCGLDPKKLDPITAAMVGLGDTKNSMKMDPLLLAAMGMDQKTLQSMGIDQKTLQSLAMDPKAAAAMGLDSKSQGSSHDSKLQGIDSKNMLGLAGLDPKMLQLMGIDPKIMQSLAMDPKMMQSLGLDPKMMQSLGLDPKLLGLDNKSIGMDQKTLQALGLDQKSLQAMGLDPKMLGLDQRSLQAMGLDAKSIQALGMDPKTLGLDPKMMQAMGLDQKTLQAMGLDQKSLQNMGLDAKMLQAMGLDQKSLQAMGLDQKSLQAMGLDQKSLQAMGLDQKSLQAMGLDQKSLQSMGLDQKSLQAMGLDQKSLQSMGLDQKALQSMGLDPKSLQSMGLDQKMLQSMGLDQKSLQAMGLDQKTLQSMGLDQKTLQSMGLDQKSLQAMGLDQKTLQSMGLDQKTLQSMGLDQKSLQAMGLDQKTLQSMGLDQKALQSMGLDQKSLQAMGLDQKALQAMGLDQKALQAMGLDQKTLQSMGLDQKALQSVGLDQKMLQAMGLDQKSLQAMGLDQKSLQAMGLDQKSLQAMGLDPKTLQALGLDPASLQALGLDPKMLQAIGMDPKALQAMGLDPKLLQAMGLDPKLFQPQDQKRANPSPSPGASAKSSADSKTSAKSEKSQQDMLATALGMDPKKVDPAMMASLGLDPKNMKWDPWTMAALGLDPKNPNSSMMAAMASMDPAQLSAMYAYGMPGMMGNMLGMPGMDMGTGKGKMSPNVLSKEQSRSAASPRASLASPSPRPPSRASVKSEEHRKSPRTSSASMPSPKPPTPASTSSSFGNLTAAQLGFDPKILAGLDPKMLHAAGIDPKLFSNLDSKQADKKSDSNKLLSSLDPLMLGLAGLDPKLDSKMLQAAGFDLKMLQDPKALASLDPSKLMAALDPKLFSSMDPKLAGLDTKLLSGLDAKMLAGLDPKSLAGMDPKLLFGGLDPKMLGFDPKLLGYPDIKVPSSGARSSTPSSTATSASALFSNAPSHDPRLLGLDPKMLQGLDAKSLQSLGLDPKTISGLLEPQKSLPPRSSPSLSRQHSSRDSPSRQSPSKGSSKQSTTTTFSNTQSRVSPSASLSSFDHKLLMDMDPKLAASYGIDPKLLASLDPKALAGFDPKMFGLDPKQLGGIDPKLLGLDPKLLAGIDSKTLASFGLDPKSLSKSDTAKGLGAFDPKMLGLMDPKMMGIDPKMLVGIDAATLMSMGIDPKKVGPDTDTKSRTASKGHDVKSLGFDPKMFGMDPKMMAGLDPKLLAGMDPKLFGGIDPKLLAGLDPKMLGDIDPKLLVGFDPKIMAGLDPKLLSGFDPKLMAGLDPKVLSSLDPKMFGGLDPKLLGLDPSMAAMLSLAMPPSSMAGAMPNGMGLSPTPSSSGKGSSSKPKPGTVAAALEEKKKSEKSATIVRPEEDHVIQSRAPESLDGHDEDDGADESDSGDKLDSRKGLTSEERVLLREKKRERLLKEKDPEDEEKPTRRQQRTSSKDEGSQSGSRARRGRGRDQSQERQSEEDNEQD